MLDFNVEQQLYANGYRVVCGVDEAGRGCLCGPVYAAAVVLPRGYENDLLNDSKKLSAVKRDKVYEHLIRNAVSYSIAFADVDEIERFNILGAAMLAMNRAVEGLNCNADIALVDGNIARGFSCEVKTVVKGDSIYPSIAAASVLAKVARDKRMQELDRLFPEYSIAKHKGYATAVHIAAIKQYGPSKIHRLSFLKKIYG